MDVEQLARAYDAGFADAEESVRQYGEKRWAEPSGVDWSEEEFDSYWAGYEDYQVGIVVEDVQVEYTQDGAVITGTVPEVMRKFIEATAVKGFSIE